jgi:hypothetical protein
MDAANQILSELNGRVDAGDVDGGMATLSKIKVSFDPVLKLTPTKCETTCSAFVLVVQELSNDLD